MKRMLLAVVIVLFLSLTGCGQHNWKHSTRPETRWTEDIADCMSRAEAQVGGIKTGDSVTAPAKGGEVRYLFEQCMAEKGYYR